MSNSNNDFTTKKIKKEPYLTPECDHVCSFVALLGIFEAQGNNHIAGIHSAEEYTLGWAKVYKVTKVHIIEATSLKINDNYSGLFTSYFSKGFYFSYDLDMSAFNGNHHLSFSIMVNWK